MYINNKNKTGLNYMPIEIYWDSLIKRYRLLIGGSFIVGIVCLILSIVGSIYTYYSFKEVENIYKETKVSKDEIEKRLSPFFREDLKNYSKKNKETEKDGFGTKNRILKIIDGANKSGVQLEELVFENKKILITGNGVTNEDIQRFQEIIKNLDKGVSFHGQQSNEKGSGFHFSLVGTDAAHSKENTIH